MRRAWPTATQATLIRPRSSDFIAVAKPRPSMPPMIEVAGTRTFLQITSLIHAPDWPIFFSLFPTPLPSASDGTRKALECELLGRREIGRALRRERGCQCVEL